MPRMMMLALLRIQGRQMASVMNCVFLLLDENNYSLKSMIENEVFSILKHWKNEVDDALREGMTTKEFAAYLIFDALKSRLSSGSHHVYRGVLSVNGNTLSQQALKTVNLLLSMNLVHPDKADVLLSDIRIAVSQAG